MEKWREVGGPIGGHLPLAGAVRIHDEDFQLPWLHQPLVQQGLVFLDLRRVARMRGPIDDSPAIGRKEGTSVIAELVSQATEMGSIQVHSVDV